MNLNAILNSIAMPVRILIVVAVLVGIVYSVYDLVSPLETTPTDPVTRSSQPTVRVDDIARVNLFGSEEQPEEINIEQLATTTLNLTLVSVVFDEANPDMSWARIAQGSQKPKKFTHGDRIAGVANLSEVLRDRVILERLGQRELLAFDSEYDYFEPRELVLPLDSATEYSGDSGFIHQQVLVDDKPDEGSSSHPTGGGSDTMEQDPSDKARVRGSRELIESYREKLEENPQQFLQEMGLTPVSQDKASGYRVNESLAKQLGLRKGDILTSINGETLGDIESDLPRVLSQLNSSSAKLQVRRGEETISIEIPLDQ
jgi:general secretion pathway protein C